MDFEPITSCFSVERDYDIDRAPFVMIFKYFETTKFLELCIFTFISYFSLVLLNKLLEDGNVLFRKGRLTDAAYRYEYALRRLPRLRPDAASTTTTTSEDIFAQMKTHLLLNLSRTKRKLGQYKEAEDCAGQVLASRPQCHEAWWARAKAR